jgi:hypothetical protein
MLAITGDLWTVDADWRLIPTNTVVRRDGRAVMGAGAALQAAQRYPALAADLGTAIRALRWAPLARPVSHFPAYRLSCLPTKYDWRANSDFDLIRRGLLQFVDDLPTLHVSGAIALPMLGCGLGGLPVATVRPLLERLLDDRFVLVLPAGARQQLSGRPELERTNERNGVP